MYAYETQLDSMSIDALSIPTEVKKKILKSKRVKIIILTEENEEKYELESSESSNSLFSLCSLVKEGDLTDGSINHDRDIYSLEYIENLEK